MHPRTGRYIAKVTSPTTVAGNRTKIHSPYWSDGMKKEWQWVCRSLMSMTILIKLRIVQAPNSYVVNEGPEILVYGNQTFTA
jgi:hypothetical protein